MEVLLFCGRAQPPVCKRLWLKLIGHLALALNKLRLNNISKDAESMIFDPHTTGVGRRRREQVGILLNYTNILRTEHGCAKGAPDGLGNSIDVGTP